MVWHMTNWTCMPGTQWHVVGFAQFRDCSACSPYSTLYTRVRVVFAVAANEVCACASPLTINLASRASKWSSPNYITMANQGSHSRIQMLTSIRRLASIVTRCRSLISSGPSDLTPNGLSKGTVLGEHAISVRKESRGGQGQLTRQCLHRGLHNVHYIVAQVHANRHSASG